VGPRRYGRRNADGGHSSPPLAGGHPGPPGRGESCRSSAIAGLQRPSADGARRMGRSRAASIPPGGIEAACAIAFVRIRPGLGPMAGVGGGSGWSSRSAVRTGRLRRSPAVHSRPIDLVVFQEPSGPMVHGSLVSEGASRLDAFSAYPVPTWLPGDAPSGTAGTPEVGPPQSSRTRGDAPQASHAHGR
jgi:hypothetical protein